MADESYANCLVMVIKVWIFLSVYSGILVITEEQKEHSL